MPRQSSITEDQRGKIAELKAQNKDYKEIGRLLKLNPARVLWYMAESGLVKLV